LSVEKLKRFVLVKVDYSVVLVYLLILNLMSFYRVTQSKMSDFVFDTEEFALYESTNSSSVYPTYSPSCVFLFAA